MINLTQNLGAEQDSVVSGIQIRENRVQFLHNYLGSFVLRVADNETDRSTFRSGDSTCCVFRMVRKEFC